MAFAQSEIETAAEIDFESIDDQVSPATVLVQMGFSEEQAQKFA